MSSFNLQVENPEKIILGMGCFWGPESQLGSLPGVISTATGYAGGHTPFPTYRSIGDHTETVEVVFAPQILPLEELLRFFWQNHHAAKDRFYRARQYISLLILENSAQQQIAEKIKLREEKITGKEIQTEFQIAAPFYPAEFRHQKYYLRRFTKAQRTVAAFFPDEATFNRSTIAARLNGFVRENGTLLEIKQEIKEWGLSKEKENQLFSLLQQLKW